MKDKDLVYLVALDVRAWAELYQKTSPGRYWDGLGGLCAIASYKLMNYLDKVGIKSKFVIADSHCYLQVEDYVVDITATQFSSRNFPKIMILHQDDISLQKSKWHKPIHICENEEEIDYHLKRWPEYQKPKLKERVL